MSKNTLFWVIVMLVIVGGWTLHIRIVLEDVPFLIIGFLAGWYFRSRWKP